MTSSLQEAILGHLGGILAVLRPILGQLGPILGPSWRHVGHPVRPKSEHFAWDILQKWEDGDINSSYDFVSSSSHFRSSISAILETWL